MLSKPFVWQSRSRMTRGKSGQTFTLSLCVPGAQKSWRSRQRGDPKITLRHRRHTCASDCHTKGLDNIVALLEYSDRVREINLRNISSLHYFEKVLAATQKPFPLAQLTNLTLWSPHRVAAVKMPVVLDSFLGASAPHLREPSLELIPFPGLPKLLSATNLVGSPPLRRSLLWVHFTRENDRDPLHVNQPRIISPSISIPSISLLSPMFISPDTHCPPSSHLAEVQRAQHVL